MKSGIKSYLNEWEDQLNIPLIEKEMDRPLVDYIVDVFKSLEVIKCIHFDSYEYTENISDIDINRHIFKRDKKKRKKDRYNIKMIDDTRNGKLTIYMTVNLMETNPTTGQTAYQSYPIKKEILIPLKDSRGRYFIKGKEYYLLYQIAEKSTYTGVQTLTLKSLMPVTVRRYTQSAEDINGNKYTLPFYHILMYNRDIPIMLFYMAQGASYTLDFLNVANFMRFVDELPHSSVMENNIYFQISQKCYLEVDKDMFNKSQYVQSIVGSFCGICTNRTTLESLEEPAAWIKKIANPNNYEKGLNQLSNFARLLDETTKKILVIPEYHRKDIYTVLRWIMQEFQELRLKDNCDLRNKRLRCNEYIASLLTADFSDRIKNLYNDNNIDIDKVRNVFKFPGNIIADEMYKSGIVRFDDNVNDMDFFAKCKYTTKGPNAHGGKNSNSVSMKYRAIHYSMLGRTDILVC